MILGWRLSIAKVKIAWRALTAGSRSGDWAFSQISAMSEALFELFLEIQHHTVVLKNKKLLGYSQSIILVVTVPAPQTVMIEGVHVAPESSRKSKRGQFNLGAFLSSKKCIWCARYNIRSLFYNLNSETDTNISRFKDSDRAIEVLRAQIAYNPHIISVWRPLVITPTSGNLKFNLALTD